MTKPRWPCSRNKTTKDSQDSIAELWSKAHQNSVCRKPPEAKCTTLWSTQGLLSCSLWITVKADHIHHKHQPDFQLRQVHLLMRWSIKTQLPQCCSRVKQCYRSLYWLSHSPNRWAEWFALSPAIKSPITNDISIFPKELKNIKCRSQSLALFCYD